MATITPRGKSWQLNWVENGKRERKSLGQISKTEAERIKRQKEYELDQGTIESPYFDFFAAEYLEWYQTRYPSSFERVRHIVVERLSPFFQGRCLHEIDGRNMKNYELHRSIVSTGTYLKEFRTLKAMLNRAVEWEHLKENPIEHIRPPKDINSKPPHYFTKEELERIYEVANYADQWQFMANTGLRLSEAINIDLEKDVTNGRVFVLSTNEARSKSGKWREIPLFHGASESLRRLLENDNKLFRIHKKSVSRAFKKDLNKLQIDGSLHSLRHSFVSHLAMSGKFSITQIRDWAGHKSIVTTQRYQHLIPNYQDIDIDSLNI